MLAEYIRCRYERFYNLYLNMATIRYNKNLKLLARHLRNNSTPEEIKLWMRLRRNQFMGYDFHRQKPMGQFIADFYCHALMLVIEVDGSGHFTCDDTKMRDAKKDEYIHSLGFTIMRFSNAEVTHEMANVLMRLEQYAMDFETSKTLNGK